MSLMPIGVLKTVINGRGVVSVQRDLREDAIWITVTEKFRTVSKRVYSRSPWMPELCAALRIDNPFAR